MLTYIGIILAIIAILVFTSIVIVSESSEIIIERLGKYHKTCSAGLNFKIPLIDNIRQNVSLKERTLDTSKQTVITRDNVSAQIDAIVYFKVIDSHNAVYKIENLNNALANLAITNLRSIVGDKDLEQMLSDRKEINIKMLHDLDEAVNKWGVDVTRVEIQDILPPSDVLHAMERQLTAERNKRGAVLDAEAYKESQILKAEGEKQAQITKAEATKKSRIIESEGKAKSLQLETEAKKLAYTELLDININSDIMKIEQLEAFKKMTENPANKVIISSELTGIANFGEVLKSSLETGNVK